MILSVGGLVAHCQKTLVNAMCLAFAAEKGKKRLPIKVIFRVFSDYSLTWVGGRLREKNSTQNSR